MTENEERSLNELTAAARTLSTSLTELNRDAADKIIVLMRLGRSNRRMIVALALSFTFDMILTVLLAFGFVQIGETQSQIQDVRTVERRDALCPLYEQFVNADTPKGRELAKRNGQDLERRDEAFRVIRRGFDALQCYEFHQP